MTREVPAAAGRAAGRAASCGGCGRAGPLQLQMTVRTGETLSLVSCPRCETRTWFADDDPISRDDLYRLASGKDDFTLSPSKRR